MVSFAVISLQVDGCVIVLWSFLVPIVLATGRCVCISEGRVTLRVMLSARICLIGRLVISLTYLIGVCTSCTLLMET